MKASIWASLLFSIVYNIIGLGLAASGLLSPIIAAIMMPVSSLVVIAISVFSARLGMRLFDEQKHTGGRPWA